jgi:hypothetical protein
MDKQVRTLIDIQCGELHCIDTSKHERCEYLPFLDTGVIRCQLFYESLTRTTDGNFVRCDECKEAEVV